ncbi:MAG: hypothetical protein MZV70_22330 [Desulfobacterales bacterium]|nr:hypothetical protein [Desulfobacterales bacterium]
MAARIDELEPGRDKAEGIASAWFDKIESLGPGAGPGPPGQDQGPAQGPPG